MIFKIIIFIGIAIYLLPVLLFLFIKDEKEEYQCKILEEIRVKKLIEEESNKVKKY